MKTTMEAWEEQFRPPATRLELVAPLVALGLALLVSMI